MKRLLRTIFGVFRRKHAINQLPKVIAPALVITAMKQPDALFAAAGGFFDTTREASGDPSKTAKAILANQQEILASLDAFLVELETLRAAIAAENEGEIKRLISGAKELRDRIK